MVHDDELLSIDAASQLLGVSRQALYTIVDERGELPVAEERMIGRQRRRFFRRADVLALKRQREGQAVDIV